MQPAGFGAVGVLGFTYVYIRLPALWLWVAVRELPRAFSTSALNRAKWQRDSGEALPSPPSCT